MLSFRDQHKELTTLIQEYLLLRALNDERSKSGLVPLLFSEASVLCVAFERFLRIIPDIRAEKTDTLSNLLDKAFSKKKPVFQPVHSSPSKDFQKTIKEIRNGIAHGNFEQLAEFYIQNKSVSNTEEYLQKYFAQDLEIIYKTFDELNKQVDLQTGKIKSRK